MRYGARPDAEWKHQRTEAPPRQKWSREPRITEAWPMPWVGREAVYTGDSQVYAWDEFLNRLGRENRRLGSARAVGSIAITYFEGTTIQRMLQDRFDKYHHSRRKAIDIQRRFANGLRGFIRQQVDDDIKHSPERIASQRAKIQFYFEDEHGHRSPSDMGPLDSREILELSDTRFSEASLTVTGLGIYGKNHIGLDLSQNEILYRERSSMIKYFRSEGFNTNRIDSDGEWAPHAVVFDMHDHISSRSQVIAYEEPSCPRKMSFLDTKIDSYG